MIYGIYHSVFYRHTANARIILYAGLNHCSWQGCNSSCGNEASIFKDAVVSY